MTSRGLLAGKTAVITGNAGGTGAKDSVFREALYASIPRKKSTPAAGSPASEGLAADGSTTPRPV